MQSWKNTTSLKWELTQAKQQLEKLYTSSEKIDEHIFHQRPSYEKIGHGYLLGEKSAKKDEVRIQPYSITKIPKDKFKWFDEVEKIELIENFDELRTAKQVEEPKQDDSSKEVRHEFKGRCFICNKFGHMKRD